MEENKKEILLKKLENINKIIEKEANEKNYFKRGTIYKKLKNYSKAIEDYDKVIKLNSNDAGYYNGRGSAKYSLGEYKESVEDYNKAIKLNPNKVSYYNKRGNGKYKLGEYKESIEDYNKTIELNSNNATFYGNRGSAKYSLGEYKESIEDYNKAIELSPNNASYYNGRGNGKYSLGEYKESIEDYNKAIELNSNNATFYGNRGSAKYSLGEYKESIEDYNKAIELSPNNASYYNGRGNGKYSLGEYKESIEDYNKAIELNSNNATFYGNRGSAKYRLREYKESIEDYNKAIELNPNNKLYRNNKEKAEEALKNKQKIENLEVEDSIKSFDESNFENAYSKYLDACFNKEEDNLIWKEAEQKFSERLGKLDKKENLNQQEIKEKEKCKKYLRLSKSKIAEIKGLLTFADILGWKKIWQKNDKESNIEKLIDIKENLLEEIKNNPVKISLISDTFFISVMEETQKNFEIFEINNLICKKLIELCLKNNLLIRGATAYGEFYVKDTVYMGQTVDEAASWHEKGEEVGIFYTSSARLKLWEKYHPLDFNILKNINLKRDEVFIKNGKMDTYYINWHNGENKSIFYKIMKSEIIYPEISQKYFNTEKRFIIRE